MGYINISEIHCWNELVEAPGEGKYIMILPETLTA